jgi:hypothetical protein
MKRIARAILRAILHVIIHNLPENRREYAKAMLAELEEMNGWTALAWATGGIQLWLHTQQGVIMKMAAFWLGITGLYVTLNFGFAMSIFMATFDMIAFIALRRSSVFACRKPA